MLSVAPTSSDANRLTVVHKNVAEGDPDSSDDPDKDDGYENDEEEEDPPSRNGLEMRRIEAQELAAEGIDGLFDADNAAVYWTYRNI